MYSIMQQYIKLPKAYIPTPETSCNLKKKEVQNHIHVMKQCHKIDYRAGTNMWCTYSLANSQAHNHGSNTAHPFKIFSSGLD